MESKPNISRETLESHGIRYIAEANQVKLPEHVDAVRELLLSFTDSVPADIGSDRGWRKYLEDEALKYGTRHRWPEAKAPLDSHIVGLRGFETDISNCSPNWRRAYENLESCLEVANDARKLLSDAEEGWNHFWRRVTFMVVSGKIRDQPGFISGLDDWSLEGNSEWTGFREFEPHDSDSAINLTKRTRPKPDLTYAFPILKPSPANLTALHRDDYTRCLSVEPLVALKGLGIHCTPTSGIQSLADSSPSNRCRTTQLSCFPWAIVEFKRDVPKAAVAPVTRCCCQAANASAAALALYAQLYSRVFGNDYTTMPPVIAFTCVGPEVKVWLTYYSTSRSTGKSERLMVCIWSTTVELTWGVATLRRIIANMHTWAARLLKPKIQSWVFQALRQHQAIPTVKVNTPNAPCANVTCTTSTQGDTAPSTPRANAAIAANTPEAPTPSTSKTLCATDPVLKASAHISSGGVPQIASAGFLSLSPPARQGIPASLRRGIFPQSAMGGDSGIDAITMAMASSSLKESPFPRSAKHHDVNGRSEGTGVTLQETIHPSNGSDDQSSPTLTKEKIGKNQSSVLFGDFGYGWADNPFANLFGTTQGSNRNNTGLFGAGTSKEKTSPWTPLFDITEIDFKANADEPKMPGMFGFSRKAGSTNHCKRNIFDMAHDRTSTSRSATCLFGDCCHNAVPDKPMTSLFANSHIGATTNNPIRSSFKVHCDTAVAEKPTTSLFGNTFNEKATNKPIIDLVGKSDSGATGKLPTTGFLGKPCNDVGKHCDLYKHSMVNGKIDANETPIDCADEETATLSTAINNAPCGKSTGSQGHATHHKPSTISKINDKVQPPLSLASVESLNTDDESDPEISESSHSDEEDSSDPGSDDTYMDSESSGPGEHDEDDFSDADSEYHSDTVSLYEEDEAWLTRLESTSGYKLACSNYLELLFRRRSRDQKLEMLETVLGNGRMCDDCYDVNGNDKLTELLVTLNLALPKDRCISKTRFLSKRAGNRIREALDDWQECRPSNLYMKFQVALSLRGPSACGEFLLSDSFNLTRSERETLCDELTI